LRGGALGAAHTTWLRAASRGSAAPRGRSALPCSKRRSLSRGAPTGWTRTAPGPPVARPACATTTRASCSARAARTSGRCSAAGRCWRSSFRRCVTRPTASSCRWEPARARGCRLPAAVAAASRAFYYYLMSRRRQGYEDAYKPGTCEELLKWKFAHLNSVDFLLRSTAAGAPPALSSALFLALPHKRLTQHAVLMWVPGGRAGAVPAGDAEGPAARPDPAAGCVPRASLHRRAHARTARDFLFVFRA